MKIAAQYQGVVLTDRCLQIHFKLTIGGSTVRHHHVKVPLDQLSKEVWATAMDRAARRRLLEIWAAEDNEPLPWE